MGIIQMIRWKIKKQELNMNCFTQDCWMMRNGHSEKGFKVNTYYYDLLTDKETADIAWK